MQSEAQTTRAFFCKLQNILEVIPELFYEVKQVIQQEQPIISTATLSMLYDLCWEKLHFSGHWASVSPIWRATFGLIVLLQVLEELEKNDEKNAIIGMIRKLDVGLMMLGPNEELHELLEYWVHKVHKYAIDTFGFTQVEQQVEQASKKPTIVHIAHDIPRYKSPTMQQFKQIMAQHVPCIITQAIEHWPARAKWQDLNYLLSVAAYRTVPIELGHTYVDSDWQQKLLTFTDYVHSHIAHQDDKHVGYLAQHALFDQIEELQHDILEPDYCSLGELQSINAWFGPSRTVSPLHTDPHENLLAQVVGCKYVRLYSPDYSAHVYPRATGLLTNTSEIINVFTVDDAQYPLFNQAQYVECELKPGEMLYIPKGWWHYVESLQTSFSVSFWF